MGQVRPVLLERQLRFVGWSWGQGKEGGEASARSEPRLVRACFHAADGCDAPTGLAESSKSSEEEAEEGGLGCVGGDLRVVTGASEGEPVEAGL